jgi:hypothetical protein
MIAGYTSVCCSLRPLCAVSPIVESVFVPTGLETHKWLLIRRLETENQETDPDRNLERSEIRLDLVRKPARPDAIDRHGERFTTLGAPVEHLDLVVYKR